MTRLLVVEDSRTQAHEIRLILEAGGFAVEVAGDGEEGLALLRASAFDMVLTDVVMPRLSGFDLCRTVKADPHLRHTPIVLLTSLGDPADIMEGIACGADNFITKPYRPSQLLGRVRGLLASPTAADESGAEVAFLGRQFAVTSGREQLLRLLASTCEEIVLANRELRAAKARVERRNGRLADRVRESEGKYHTLMERAGDAILVLDPLGRVLEVNLRAEELLGRPRAGLVGRAYHEFVSPAERDGEREKFWELLAGGPARSGSARLVRADGSAVTADLSASVVEVGGEQVVLLIARDATERARLEQHLRQAQKMEAVGRLAGGVAHDFNNLLTVINGYADMLLGDLPAGDPGRWALAEIRQAGDRAAALTRQLLAFSRQQVTQPEVLDLNAVVAETGGMLRRLIGEDVELTTDLAPDLGRVLADRGQLGQVLLNLIVNARDAMPQGGKLTIATANVELGEDDLRLRPGCRGGRYALLTVSDTGCGMDEATLARVFEPFFTTKGPGQGTGLGLATVYGIVKQSEGYVYASSAPGRGTTFQVYLPRVEAQFPCAEAPETAGAGPAGSETVLLVEDEAAVREFAATALRRAGYTVLEVAGGEEALRLAAGHPGPVPLLVTDVVMPGMGGRLLAERLQERHPGLRVLYLSGYTDDAVVRHGVREAEVAFLQKPFTAESLARKVREVLDQPGSPADGPPAPACPA